MHGREGPFCFLAEVQWWADGGIATLTPLQNCPCCVEVASVPKKVLSGEKHELDRVEISRALVFDINLNATIYLPMMLNFLFTPN
jgi:hypothetical protein